MHLPRLSIFARSFLMMVCALLVSVAIGFEILLLRPPVPPASVNLFELIAALQPDDVAFAMHSFDHGGGPPDDDKRGPPPGAGFRPPGDSDLDIAVVAQPPAIPAAYDGKGSARMAMRLSDMLNVPVDQLRVYLQEDDMRRGGSPMHMSIGAGSVVALRQGDGTWRIATVPEEHFPSMLQVELLWLLVLGMIVLMPLAWLFARALSAPISRFGEAAQRLGADTAAPPVPREGPPEMRQAVDAFNAMQSRVNRLLHERTHMIAAIAHDLRTPLTRLSFRLDGLPDPLGKKVDGDIQEMKTMISAALDFMRDRSLAMHRQPLDFRLLVESVADDLVDVGHDVSVQRGAPLTLQGDPLALRRAVVNLVENGLKYGERVRLHLRAGGHDCVLEVDDDGPGVPEPMQQQVFEPFFRLEASRNRDTGGIGLGLATVRAIVLDHGGTVTLRNRKDGGLRVVVNLPMDDPAGS